MTIEPLILNGLLTVLPWALLLGVLLGFVGYLTKLQWKYVALIWVFTLLLIAFNSSANHPKIKITDETRPRVVETIPEIKDLSPKKESYEERMHKNQKLYNSNK